MTIENWLKLAQEKLKQADITSHKIDAELLLSFCLKKERTFLHAHGDKELNHEQTVHTDELLQKRLERRPIAYLISSKDFYNHSFYIDERVLIPRPESEQVVEFALEHLKNQPKHKNIVDVGTGSGAIGISIKLANKNAEATLADVSQSALEVAKINTKKLQVKVEIKRNNLLENWPDKIDLIVANLPYLNNDISRSPETEFEPSIALFAANDGLELIFKLITQATELLNSGGGLILECEPYQKEKIIKFAEQFNFSKKETSDFVIYLIKD